MEPTTPALQSEVLTTGLPGKSLATYILKFSGKEKIKIKRIAVLELFFHGHDFLFLKAIPNVRSCLQIYFQVQLRFPN